jgi:hypothetical protein
MKKLLIAVCIFTSLAFLALPMGEIAQSQQPMEDIATYLGQFVKVKMIKGFVKDNTAWTQVETMKRVNPNKVFGEMVIEGASGDMIIIVITNPCTYVRVGNTYYKKCY